MKVQGLKTRYPGAALPPGFFSALENVRWCGEDTISVRSGLGTTLGTVGSSGSPCGHATLLLNGTTTHLTAIDTGAVVEVYKSTDGGATWTQITASSGKYGDTRLTTGYKVDFETARAPFATSSVDYLIISNGYDYPRVYNPNTGLTAIHQPITADDGARNVPMKLKPYTYLTVSDQANTTYATSGGGVTMADTGTSPDNTVRISITAATAQNDYATCSFGTSCTPSTDCKQVLMGVETAYAEFLDYCKVELYNGTSYTTIYDPYSTSSSVNLPPVTIGMDGTGNRTLIAFPLDTAAFTAAFGTQWTTNILKVTFAAPTAKAPGSTQTVDIFLLAFSGTRDPGFTTFGIAYRNQGASSFSPGVVYAKRSTVRVREAGGPTMANVQLPESELLYYMYDVTVHNTSTSDRDKGVDYMDVYRALPGEPQLRWIEPILLASWGGASWSFSSGTAASARVCTLANFNPLTQYSSTKRVLMPSGDHLAMPKAKTMLQANGRLFAAAVDGESSKGLYVSSSENQFRFLKIADGDEGETSPFAEDFPGEQPQAFASSSASAFGSSSVFGASSVYIFTNRNVYAVGGRNTSELARIVKVAPHGTLNPASVVDYLGQVFWIDQEMQLRRLAGGPPDNLSRYEVDDLLDAIPTTRLDDVCAECAKDRLFVFFTASGGTQNKRVLVWNIPFGKWESLDKLGGHDVSFASRWDDSGTSKTMTVGSDRTVRLYESSQTVDGTSTPIDAKVECWISVGGSEFTLRESAVHMDQKAATWTVTRTFAPSGGSLTGTITTTAGSYWDWLIESDLTQAEDAFGKWAKVSLTASTENGGKLYRWTVGGKPTNGGPAAA